MSFAGKAGKLGALDNLLEFVFPSLCLICSNATAVPGDLICHDCRTKATALSSVTCSNCRGVLDENWKCPRCVTGSYFPIAALGYYVDPLKEIIHQFKYGGYYKLGQLLAGEWLDHYRDRLVKMEMDTVIPIPLDSYREKKRGFNQAAILSDIIERELNLAPPGIALAKIRRTKDQTRLTPVQREINMRDSFRVEIFEKKPLKILLVDDVITTGATMREAIRALTAVGIMPLMAATIAITK